MIYFDRFEWKGRIYGHLISDTSHEELHNFARKLGLKREWFQVKPNPKFSHYDLTTVSAIKRAKQAGAVEIGSRELMEKIHSLKLS